MHMTKKDKMTAMILAISFIAYNVILFVLCGFTEHTGVFWTSWLFMLVAFFTMASAGVLLGQKGIFLRDWLFGYPIIKHSTIYIVAEFCASTLFIILEKHIKWGWTFAVQFLFLCIYGVCAVSCFLAKETIDDIHSKVGGKTEFWKLLRADAEMLTEKCEDILLKAEFQQLSDTIRYSDPISSDLLTDLEGEISTAVAECIAAVSDKNYSAARELSNKAMLLLSERNKKCKALK